MHNFTGFPLTFGVSSLQCYLACEVCTPEELRECLIACALCLGLPKQVIGALLGNYATVKERKMRNSIVILVVILSALLVTPRTNARDISLGDAPSSGLCCFQGPKDWPNLDSVTNHRSEIQVVLLDIDALGFSLAPRDEVEVNPHLSTTLALAARSTLSGSVALPSWQYAEVHPLVAYIDTDSIHLDFTHKSLGFGISMEESAELIFAGIISAPLSYPSAASNTN